MILEIVTPEATLLHTDVNLLTVPGVNGEFQMLDNHAPIVSLLVKGTVKFEGDSVNIDEQYVSRFTNSKGEYSLPIKSGTIEMKENKVIILAD